MKRLIVGSRFQTPTHVKVDNKSVVVDVSSEGYRFALGLTWEQFTAWLQKKKIPWYGHGFRPRAADVWIPVEAQHDLGV